MKKQPTVAKGSLSRWSWALVVVATVSVLLNIVYLDRGRSYDTLLLENLSQRDALMAVEQKMSELDRILLRFRIYDAQLSSLVEPTGDHGPLVADNTDEALSSDAELTQLLDFGIPLDDHGPDVDPSDWSTALASRVDTYLDTLVQSEPQLSGRLERHETLAALKGALPSFWPAEGKFTSGYGYRRSPFGGRYKFHSGIDVAAGRGTPIYAAGGGKVTLAGRNSSYGTTVKIDHGYGITTLYAHCSRVVVKRGEAVFSGQLVGYMGSTGRATGSHLHFEVRMDGHAVNPMDYLER